MAEGWDEDGLRAVRGALAVQDWVALLAALQRGTVREVLQLAGDGVAGAAARGLPGAAEMAASFIAAGNAARGGIADYLGRKSTDPAHPLSLLQDVGMITHEADAFRRNRSAYRIAEPLVTFYHAVMRPAWGDLERPGRASAVWQRARSTFRSKVVGPHFEQVCREWARRHAAPDTHGGHVTRVASGTVSDPGAKTSHEVDVAVHGETGNGREAILAISEAKWSDVMGVGHLERLRHIRTLLTARGSASGATRLHCYSGTGFTDELHHLAKDDRTIQLIDLPRLYHGV